MRASAPAVPGILSAREVLATGLSIAAMQQPSGAIGWPDGHIDAWNHTECAMALSVCGLAEPARRAFGWLRSSQRADGSWPKRTDPDGRVTDPAADSNQVAYVAVGVWHELLVTGDAGAAAAMWPTVRRAISFVLGLQTARGEISWERAADGTPASYALLAGCASIYQSLRCAALLAEWAGQPQPDWELAAGRLGHVVASHPEAFADKSRFSMDWYYPVLAGAVRGPPAARRLAAGWSRFVEPGLGVRCVADEPWVTGAETCELALALDAIGDRGRALALFGDAQRLRDGDGAYWTGWQFANQAHFPAERSSWTAAAMILAADALAGPVLASPVQASPVQASPVQASPVQASPVQASPVQASPVQASPVQASPVQAGAGLPGPGRPGLAWTGATGGAGVFRDAGAGPGPLPPTDSAVCGCALPAPS